MTYSATVLVADDEQPIRYLVQSTLRNSGYAVLTAACGDEALALFKQHRAHIRCLITDCQMPGMSGPQLAQRLLALQPDLHVIFMSGSGLGVMGYPLLVKPFTPLQVRACVRDAMQGVSNAELADPVTKVDAENGRRPGTSIVRIGRRDVNALTPREAEILILLAHSFSTRGIANQLRIAYKTVECHRSRIYHKLGVHKVAGLVRYAIRNGLIEA